MLVASARRLRTACNAEIELPLLATKWCEAPSKLIFVVAKDSYWGWRPMCFVLRHIPSIGSSLPVLSYLGTLRFIFHAKDIFQEGYNKYPVCRLAMLNRWVVVVSGAKMNEELLGLGSDQVSFDEALHELMDPGLTISREGYKHPIHITGIKQWLPRNSARLFPAILEEVERALEELIPDSETEWLPVHAYPKVMTIVARASNRLFIGAPLFGVVCACDDVDVERPFTGGELRVEQGHH
ncbi:hypothetical protein EVJ58_g8757 [Rhodofomes roseus]|uniref:Uncharacterized protein n=1 Tax=Rhodofomes roseus TaxID=34475 RepID=A0A4Y9XY84_9APHY|nr:hypothetical protein EVJ58_g8757 [Rhodofomes roseus]